MTPQQISAAQGLVLAVLAALVAAGTITDSVSSTVAGIAGAIITAAAAFLVKRPRDH